MAKAVARYEHNLDENAVKFNEGKCVITIDFSSVGTAIAAAEGFKTGYEKLFDMHKGSFFSAERVVATRMTSR
jgi:hypothetical protein